MPNVLRALLAVSSALPLAACSSPADTIAQNSVRAAALASAEIVLREAVVLSAMTHPPAPVSGETILAALSGSSNRAGDFDASWDAGSSSLVLTRNNTRCEVAVLLTDGSAKAGAVTCD